ncbi:hypothetical protein ACCS91_39820, partial [Rhizobium ruizarguesonis]
LAGDADIADRGYRTALGSKYDIDGIAVVIGDDLAFGQLGEKTVRPGFIQRYSRLNKGEDYSPETLKKAGERLRALGVF